MRVGYLGPAGTFSHEAIMETPGAEAWELVPVPTIHDTVMAVHERRVDRALVPIENSLEGSVNATLDALALETDDLEMVGEHVLAVRYCLLAGAPVDLAAIRSVISHPQGTAQCARFIRSRLPGAAVVAANSTAEAARMVAEGELDDARGPWAALGNRLAAELYGCEVLLADVEDVADNETRFVWIEAAGREERPGVGGWVGHGPTASPSVAAFGTPRGGEHGPWKTALVFWGVGSEAPGWLVRCLAEFSSRDVNLTRIESRPRKQGLGRYMFFVDLEGHAGEDPVAEAIAALRGHAETVRVLGSFTIAT